MSDQSKLVVIYGYDEKHAKAAKDDIVILTFSGRRVFVDKNSVESKHPVEAGGEKSGPFRYYIKRSDVVRVELQAEDLEADDANAVSGADGIVKALSTWKPADTALM